MPNYRRYYIPDAVVFITGVTRRRQPFFASTGEQQMFLAALVTVQQRYGFELLAHVLLPDHFHWLMQMPDNKWNFSEPIKIFKWTTTRDYKRNHAITTSFTLWQPRFWDHVIRSEQDFENHIDYIHYNPVHHGLVSLPGEWPLSTFGKWQHEGQYDLNLSSEDVDAPIFDAIRD